MSTVKVIIEKQPHGHVAHPFVLKGVIVGQAESDEAPREAVRSALRFPVETFREAGTAGDPSVLAAFVAGAGLSERRAGRCRP